MSTVSPVLHIVVKVSIVLGSYTPVSVPYSPVTLTNMSLLHNNQLKRAHSIILDVHVGWQSAQKFQSLTSILMPKNSMEAKDICGWKQPRYLWLKSTYRTFATVEDSVGPRSMGTIETIDIGGWVSSLTRLPDSSSSSSSSSSSPEVEWSSAN